MEKIFRSLINDCINKNKRQFFVSKCRNISFFMPSCYFKNNIIKRFITFRLKINPRKMRIQKNKQYYGSKIMAIVKERVIILRNLNAFLLRWKTISGNTSDRGKNA